MTTSTSDEPAKPRFLSPNSPPHIGTLIALSGVSALGMNLFLPSLPSMAKHFDVTAGVMGLSVGLYLLINGILQFFIGPVSDKYGRRRVILWGIFAYLIATLVCIFAPNITVFLIFRMIQAAISVAMVLSRAVVRDTVPANEAGSKIAYVTMGMAIVPMIGPAIGGFFEQHFGWEANFWLLFAAGLAIFALAWFDLGETARPSSLTLSEQYGEVPEILKSPRFWGYSMASGFSAGAFFAFLGGAPFVATTVYELEPQELGLYFAAPSLGYFFGNYVAGRYSSRLGINRMLMIGLTILVAATGMMLALSLAGLQTLELFFLLMVPVGFGNGMSIPNGVSGAISVRPHLAGTASGVNGAMMLGGGAGLSALAGWLLEGGVTETPLVALMFATVSAGMVAVLLVIRRERRLRGAV